MEITPYENWDGRIPAIISDMPNEAYHAHESISKTGLDLLSRSPAHYRRAPPRKATRAMTIGSALDAGLLEPSIFRSSYINSGAKDRTASEYKQAVKSVGTDELVLTANEYAGIQTMIDSVWSDPTARAQLDMNAHRQLSVFAIDPETGVTVRCRFDLVSFSGGADEAGVAVDLKKTQDARAPAFERSIINYRYYVQAPFYLDVLRWASGIDINEFRILAVEEKPPHGLKVYRIDDTAMAEGRKDYRADLDRYAECLESDEWPAYDTSEVDLIGLPEWRLRQIEGELDDAGIVYSDDEPENNDE